MALQAAFIVPHPPLIIPAVGRGEEREIQSTIDAYKQVAREIADLEPQTIIISSPHATAYRDYFHISPGTGAHGNMNRFRAFNTELGCTYDTELVGCITDLCNKEGFAAGSDYERDPELDHGTYIPLFFINQFMSDYKVVRIGLSGFDQLEHYHLGELVGRAVEQLGRKAVFVASGDLSHKLTEDGPYGFSADGPIFDSQITRAMATGDFLQFLNFEESFADKAAECGLRSFQIMAGALDGYSVEPKLLSYEGPFGVGYAIASFHVNGRDRNRHFGAAFAQTSQETIEKIRSEEDTYVRLARASVEHFVRTGTPLEQPSGLPEELLSKRAGVFVSLHKFGRLRGCIGTIQPDADCIADEIIRNGISACSEDSRFEPVREDELGQLEISVDVLGEPEHIASKDSLNPQKYGVIVTNGFRRGLLLPMLDGVDTVDEQIRIARSKAGISEYETCSLERFEVVRHEAGRQPRSSCTM